MSGRSLWFVVHFAPLYFFESVILTGQIIPSQEPAAQAQCPTPMHRQQYRNRAQLLPLRHIASAGQRWVRASAHRSVAAKGSACVCVYAVAHSAFTHRVAGCRLRRPTLHQSVHPVAEVCRAGLFRAPVLTSTVVQNDVLHLVTTGNLKHVHTCILCTYINIL